MKGQTSLLQVPDKILDQQCFTLSDPDDTGPAKSPKSPSFIDQKSFMPIEKHRDIIKQMKEEQELLYKTN